MSLHPCPSCMVGYDEPDYDCSTCKGSGFVPSCSACGGPLVDWAEQVTRECESCFNRADVEIQSPTEGAYPRASDPPSNLPNAGGVRDLGAYDASERDSRRDGIRSVHDTDRCPAPDGCEEVA